MFPSNIMKQVFIRMLLTLEAIKEDKHKNIYDQNSLTLYPNVAELWVRVYILHITLTMTTALEILCRLQGKQPILTLVTLYKRIQNIQYQSKENKLFQTCRLHFGS